MTVKRVLRWADRTPLKGLALILHLALARASARYLAWGETRPAVYLRAGLGSGEFVAGVSDIDLAIVLATDPSGAGVASARVWRRWEQVVRHLPPHGRVLDEPRVYDERELDDMAGSSAMTYGLDGDGEDRAALLNGELSVGRQRILFRPGLYGTTADWRLLRGPERRPPEPFRTAQERRIAGWLELTYWWRWALQVCGQPAVVATNSMHVKLIAEAARVWLWLAHGERLGTREEVLKRALRRLPEEEHAIRTALLLGRSQHPDRPSSLNDVLSALLRFSKRIALLIADQMADAGAAPVRLVGSGEHVAGSVPLCDWRALTSPSHPHETLRLRDGDPADPAALGAALSEQSGPSYAGLRRRGLLVLAAPFGERSRGRTIKSEVTDPVCFALINGSPVAHFPEVRGWSAQDTARRAVAEHRAWLRGPATSTAPWMLLSAARAALFLESVREGRAKLAPTLHGTAELLAERFPAHAVGEALRGGGWEAIRSLVLRLPGYSR